MDWTTVASLATAGGTLIEVLYGDHEGGQRTVTRFALRPREPEGWLAIQSLHWNLDRPDPR